jgi:hypothetical protein
LAGWSRTGADVQVQFGTALQGEPFLKMVVLGAVLVLLE